MGGGGAEEEEGGLLVIKPQAHPIMAFIDSQSHSLPETHGPSKLYTTSSEHVCPNGSQFLPVLNDVTHAAFYENFLPPHYHCKQPLSFSPGPSQHKVPNSPTQSPRWRKGCKLEEEVPNL